MFLTRESKPYDVLWEKQANDRYMYMYVSSQWRGINVLFLILLVPM
jgi:hypothetical protein